ncbi:hypothetical protein EON64_16465 [archaeon]|nr:MAG: hypothetical protein EON64_16465 [archaeon]
MWKKAGGDPDEYVKETLPNYGIVGALLLTITIPMIISPPTFAFGDGAPIERGDPAVFIYMLLLSVSTSASIAMIVLSGAVYQQYVNAFNSDLRVDFAAKFGYVVTIFTTLTIVDTVRPYIVYTTQCVCYMYGSNPFCSL